MASLNAHRQMRASIQLRELQIGEFQKSPHPTHARTDGLDRGQDLAAAEAHDGLRDGVQAPERLEHRLEAIPAGSGASCLAPRTTENPYPYRPSEPLPTP